MHKIKFFYQKYLFCCPLDPGAWVSHTTHPTIAVPCLWPQPGAGRNHRLCVYSREH